MQVGQDHIEIGPAAAACLGDELLAAGRFVEAEAVLRAAVDAAPCDVGTLHRLAVALVEQEQPDKCAAALELLGRIGVMYRDELVAVSCNAGKALGEMGRTAEAHAAFDGVLRAYPGHLLARYGRGLMAMQSGRHREAIADFDAVIEREPDNGKAVFARGFANLVLGNYADGFRDYEHRLKDAIAEPSQSEWTGSESICGRTILVHGEQGLGDNIMFARYLPVLVERGAKVLVWTPPSVRPLLAHLPGVTSLGDDRSAWPAFDTWIRCMSLARAFRTTTTSVPKPLVLESHTYAEMWRWCERIPSNGRLRVGLVWTGGKHSRYDAHRSIPLAQLERLFDLDATFYSLQKDVRPEDVEAFQRFPIVDLAPHLHSFRDTANAMACLDIMVTVDTSVAHLAGTVGIPTLVMLTAFRTYWLWIEKQTTSPWYPSLRLVRQARDGTWDDVVGDVRQHLASMSAARAA